MSSPVDIWIIDQDPIVCAQHFFCLKSYFLQIWVLQSLINVVFLFPKNLDVQVYKLVTDLFEYFGEITFA